MSKHYLIMDELSLPIRKKLYEAGKIESYHKGEFLFHERENVQSIFIVLEGYVALHRVNKQGEMKIIFICSPMEALNEVILERPVSSIAAKAISEVKVLKLRRSDVNQMIAENPDLMWSFFCSLSQKTRRLYHQATNTHGNHPLESRLASKIWKLARDHGYKTEEGIRIRFDLSITILASLMGAKRESVSRIISSWKKKGIVIHQDGKLTIPDVDLLKSLTD